jgi:tRNA-modifying protein YgfZ
VSAPATSTPAGTCDLVWVEGPDAEGFLQGLLTNDVAGLAVGASCRALLLDNKGHISADMRVVRTGPQDFTLVTGSGHSERLVALLDEYHFSEDVDVIGPEPFACVTFSDWDGSPMAGADLVLPGLVPGTVDAIGVDAMPIIAASEAAPMEPGALEARRIAAGIPLFGVDFTSANLVQEAGLEPTTVSFDKGCYLGQETVARVHYRGQVNRRLRGVRLGEPGRVGAAISAGDRRVGVLTSVAESPLHGSIGLAILRREVGADTPLHLQGFERPATAVDLPFDNAQKIA